MHAMLFALPLLAFVSLLQGGSCVPTAGVGKAAASDFVFLQTAVKTSKKAEDASKAKAKAPQDPKRIDLSPDADLEGTCGPLPSTGIWSGLASAEECRSSQRLAPDKSKTTEGQVEVLQPTVGTSRLQTGTVVKKVALDLSEDEED
mmetsp:Transcript_68932/g.128713  ORF Transcript_68932/g.128713 Transcript_68932/m.128713 type:complete len:146 (+) Transcript_68932:129-566(+)